MDAEKIYLEYFTPVYKYILALTGDPAEAEEITQETFFRAIKKLDNFRGESSLRVWLCQIAKNLYYDQHRRKQRIDEFADSDETASAMSGASSEEPEAMLIRKQSAMNVYRVLHNLNEPYKEVFQLRAFGDVDYREIGELFGKSESWARTTYYRARMMIKERLDED